MSCQLSLKIVKNQAMHSKTGIHGLARKVTLSLINLLYVLVYVSLIHKGSVRILVPVLEQELPELLELLLANKRLKLSES